MGSDFLWWGKQDDPVLRRALSEDLSKLFTAIDWPFEVLDKSRSLHATVCLPGWFKGRRLERHPGGGDFYRGPHELERQVLFREGVVVDYVGLPKGHRREMSFAFLDGPDLPAVLKNWIFSLSDLDRDRYEPDGSEEDETLPQGSLEDDELEGHGHQRMIGGTWELAMIMMFIKRLYIPSLNFGDDYLVEEAIAGWAEKIRLFLTPGNYMRDIFRSDGFSRYIKGEKKTEVKFEQKGNGKDNADDGLSQTSTMIPSEMARVINLTVRVNLEPDYGRYLSRLVEWMDKKNPLRLSELYRWMGESGDILGGRVVVFEDALLLDPGVPGGMFVFPLWEICARLPRFSQCFEVKRQSLLEAHQDKVADNREQEPAGGWNDGLLEPVPTEARGKVFQEFLEVVKGDREQVDTRIATSEWVVKKRENREITGWHYWDGLIVRSAGAWKTPGDDRRVAVSWTLVQELMRFVDGWEFSHCGGIGILADPVDDWICPRGAGILKKAGIVNMASLVQVTREELPSIMSANQGRSGREKYLTEILELFEPAEQRSAAAVLQLGIDLRDWLVGPEPECGPWWPLAATKACRQAHCLNCIHNESSDDVDIRVCSLRKTRIEKDEEDFCLLYQKETIYTSHKKKSHDDYPCLAFGPVYRLMAGGEVGFRPVL